jgi:hypothetical protein
LLPGCCALPHHEHAGMSWASRLLTQLPGITLVGIDERTGALDDGEAGAWMVYGKGSVTLYRNGDVQRYFSGATFRL